MNLFKQRSHSSVWQLALILSAGLILVIAPRAMGQATYGNIIGAVTDSTGAILPDAKVLTTNNGTGVKQTAQTNSSGEYTISHLTPGVYTVNVSKNGFKTFIQQAVTVSV